MDDQSVQRVAILDGRTTAVLAIWLSRIIEPFLEQQNDNTQKRLELEISFGRLKYSIPSLLYPTTIPLSAANAKASVDMGVCLSSQAPWDRIIPGSWKNVGDKLSNVTLQDFVYRILPNLDQIALGGGEFPSACAISCWTCNSHVNFDPVITDEAIKASKTNQNRVRFEKLRVSHHANSERPEKIWCLASHQKFFEGYEVEASDKESIVTLSKIVTPSITPFVSSRAIWHSESTKQLLPTNMVNDMNALGPWAVDSVQCTKKKKLAEASTFASNFASLMDFAIYAKSEEPVRIDTEQQESIDSSLRLLGQKSKPIASSPPLPANQSSSGPMPQKILPLVTVNAQTHMPGNPVVHCRKSIYFGAPRDAKSTFWKLDVSFCWRPLSNTEKSLNDFLSIALSVKAKLESLDYDKVYSELKLLEKEMQPALEIELECIDVVGLLVACNGDYTEFAKHFCSMALFAQKNFGQFRPNDLESSLFGLVPCSLPTSAYRSCSSSH